MKTLTLLVAVLWVLASEVNAQSGSVRSSAGEPVAGAAILLKNAADSSLQKVTYTNTTGQYEFVSPPQGQYFIQAHLIGFEDAYSAVFAIPRKGSWPNLQMQVKSETLNEAEVQAELPLVQVKSDKTVFNVKQSISSAASDGLDLLRKAPGLIIDNSNRIMLEGRGNVQIYVDGKPLRLRGEDRTNYLQNLSAAQIEKVELIAQPGAKYEAEGTGGIINIVLKRDENLGTLGSASLGFTQGYYPRANGSVVVNHNSGKWQLYGNYGYNDNHYRPFINLRRRQVGTVFDQRTVNSVQSRSHNFKTSAAYNLSQNQKLSLSIRGNFSDRDQRTESETPIIPDSADAASQVLFSEAEEDRSQDNFYVNLNYNLQPEKGWKMDVDLDYGRFSAESRSFQPNTYRSANGEVILEERDFRMVTPRHFDLYSTGIDLEKSLGEFNLQTGLKYSLVRTENDFRFYNVEDGEALFNINRSNFFTYDEEIAAAYAEASRQWGNWTFRAGVRAEQTRSAGDLEAYNAQGDSLVERSYLNWFPTAGISFKPSRSHQFSFRYTERISRPNYKNLNPFSYQRDELSFARGNPFLQPQYTRSFKISHLYQYRTSTALTYSHTRDYFARITDTLDVNKNFLITKNVADVHTLNLSFSTPYKINEWWSLYLSVNAYQKWYVANDPSFKPLQRFTTSGYAQSTFKVKNNWQFQVSGWASSPSIWGGTYRTKSMGSLNLSVRKKMLEDRLTVSLSLNDLLYTQPWRGTMEYGALQIEGSGGYDSRQLRLSLRYRFGNPKTKKLEFRKGSLKEESGRVE